ncbi:MAG: GFA family protein [Archangiaceae bacterium]|nr:GFA family protein [Archangiaceae bacterium]
MALPYVRKNPFTPGTRTYTGSCHCGAVRFEAQLDLSQNTTRCNCSVCAKTAAWGIIIKPSAFKLLGDPQALGDYSVSAGGHARFCKRCGIRVYGHGTLEFLGGDYVSVNLNVLDDAGLDGVQVTWLDGRADTWAPLAASAYADPFKPQPA